MSFVCAMMACVSGQIKESIPQTQHLLFISRQVCNSYSARRRKARLLKKMEHGGMEFFNGFKSMCSLCSPDFSVVQRRLSISLHLGCVGSRKGHELRWHIVGYR